MAGTLEPVSLPQTDAPEAMNTVTGMHSVYSSTYPATDAVQQTTTWTLNATTSNITGTTEGNLIDVISAADKSDVDRILLGITVIAVLVILLLMAIVVFCYVSHQKGTYYTYEVSAFKSDPELQEVTESPEDPEDPEDSEEEEP